MYLDQIRAFWIDYQTWIFAIILVVLCFASYRDPTKFRASTTGFKYVLGYLLYLLGGMSLYLLFASFPELVAKSLEEFNIDPRFPWLSDVFDIWAKFLPALASLLLLWVLVMYVGPTRRWHVRILTAIRSVVSIPIEQGLLALQLRGGDYNLFDDDRTGEIVGGNVPGANANDIDPLRKEVEGDFRDDQINEKDRIFVKSNNLRYEWARTVSLFHRYKRAFTDPKYRAYTRLFPGQLEERRESFKCLRKQVPPLINKVRTFLSTLPNSSVKPGSQQEQDLIRGKFGNEISKAREERLDPFLTLLHEDIAGIVHCCSATPIKRKVLIAKLGFGKAPGLGDIGAQLALTFFVLFFVVVFVYPAMVPERLVAVEFVIRIFANQFGAVLVALLVASTVQTGPLGLSGGLQTPSTHQVAKTEVDWRSYSGPLVKAALFGAFIGVVVGVLIERWLPTELQSDIGICNKVPLALMPATTATVLTFLIIQRSIPRRWWLDASILAVALILATMGVIYRLMPLFNDTYCKTSFDPTQNTLLGLIAISITIGASIGGLIPSSTRKKQTTLNKVNSMLATENASSKADI